MQHHRAKTKRNQVVPADAKPIDAQPLPANAASSNRTIDGDQSRWCESKRETKLGRLTYSSELLRLRIRRLSRNLGIDRRQIWSNPVSIQWRDWRLLAGDAITETPRQASCRLAVRVPLFAAMSSKPIAALDPCTWRELAT